VPVCFASFYFFTSHKDATSCSIFIDCAGILYFHLLCSCTDKVPRKWKRGIGEKREEFERKHGGATSIKRSFHKTLWGRYLFCMFCFVAVCIMVFVIISYSGICELFFRLICWYLLTVIFLEAFYDLEYNAKGMYIFSLSSVVNSCNLFFCISPITRYQQCSRSIYLSEL
jgi:hypothetical protein